MGTIKIPLSHDTAIQKQFLDEYASLYYPLFGLRRLDRDNTIVDPLYIESSQRRWKPRIDIRGKVEHQPSKKLLGKYGMDQEWDVLFLVPTTILSDLNILENNDTFLIGDLMEWNTSTFEIKDQRKDTESYFAHSSIPFYFALVGSYYREGQ